MKNEVICGDCREILSGLEDASVSCVVTSPPYALQRSEKYPSISEEEYPEWTVKWMEPLKRVLTPDGSVAIVIRPHLRKGQISDYVLKTRLAIRKAGWTECDELIWIKPQSPPLGSVYRPRRSWESILWFGKTGRVYCNPKANGTESDRIGFEAKKQVGEKHKRGISDPENPDGRGPCTKGIARCRDYVEVGTGISTDYSSDNTHPAQFPVNLAQWLVRLLSPEDGLILDPFMGSGSTALACIVEKRRWLGIEICEEYCEITNQRVRELRSQLASPTPVKVQP